MAEFSEQATQTELNRDYIQPRILKSLDLDSEHKYIWFYQSHTVLSTMLVLSLILYFSRYVEYESHYMAAFTGSLLTFIIFGATYLPKTLLYRPHPIVWKMILAMNVFWLILIVWANFFTHEELMVMIRQVDPTLPSEISEVLYDSDCRIYAPEKENPFQNVYERIDEFITAHLIGWILKVFIVRDVKLCLVLSVTFELIELSLKYYLPNFEECWWDSLIFDLLGCNLLGIAIGYYIIKWFNMKTYKWTFKPKEAKSNIINNIKSVVLQRELAHHEWNYFQSAKRFAQVVYYIWFALMVDITFFFNKYILVIPTTHNILFYRTMVIALCAIPATREYYEYISNDQQKYMGAYVWVMNLTILTETFLFFKNYEGQFDKIYLPQHIKVIWTVIALSILSIFFYLLQKDFQKQKAKKV